jgi:2-amino-4-hydroxy-6-hydroxymethyldihydropteridine diphosphokinase
MEGKGDGLRAWLGLGSNVGDRMGNLRAAVDALAARGIETTATSHVYETEAQEGAAGQDDFLNACITVETQLDPDELLRAAKAIEVELGRDPDAERHASRPIDIDILIVEGRRIDTPDYRVPHAQLRARRFVLEPLLELDPPDPASLEQALEAIEDQRVSVFGTL